jgi:hypothetical protein
MGGMHAHAREAGDEEVAPNFSDFDLGKMAQRVEGLELRMKDHEKFVGDALKELAAEQRASSTIIQRAHGALLFLSVVTSGGAIAAFIDLFEKSGGH